MLDFIEALIMAVWRVFNFSKRSLANLWVVSGIVSDRGRDMGNEGPRRSGGTLGCMVLFSVARYSLIFGKNCDQ